ncbi:hypothetical protein, partial [Streptococcus pneumoniae]|uniref:hypothetical protein n=1 Tax=Streptococcus pneumoniae TaxID=1313 RepID=UPI0018B06892
GDAGKVSAYYENLERGFASAGQLSPAETERWGVAAAAPFGQSGKIAVKYDQLTSGAAGRSRTGTVDVSQKFGLVTAKVGLRHEDRV